MSTAQQPNDSHGLPEPEAVTLPDCLRLLESMADTDNSVALILEASADKPRAARLLWANADRPCLWDAAKSLPFQSWLEFWGCLCHDFEDFARAWATLKQGEIVQSSQLFSFDANHTLLQAALVPLHSSPPLSSAAPSSVRFGVVLRNKTEQQQARREMQDLMTRAHCLLWHAQVTEANGVLQWQLDISNLEAALRWLPIRHRAEDPFIHSWAAARDPKDTERMDETSRNAILSGAASYSQEFDVKIADGQIRHLAETVQIELARPGCWNLTGVCTDATERHQAETEARDIMVGANCLIWHADIQDVAGELIWDLQFSNEEAVQRWLPIFMEPGQSFLQAWVQARLPEDQVLCDRTCLASLRARTPRFQQEFRVRLADGEIRWLAEEIQVEPLGPARWRMVGICTDITERKAEQETLSGVITRAQCLVWHASVEEQNGDFGWDLKISNSESVSRWLAIQPLPGQSFTDAWYASRFLEDNEACDQRAATALREGASGYRQEFRCRETSGRTRWLAEDVSIEVLGQGRWQLVGVCTDITERRALEEERERILAQALEQADRDPLTGLLNHRAFHAYLTREADRALRGGSVLGIAVIDLDNFKFFNDAYGHLSGDDVLRQVTSALREVCRSYDTLARFGGDEFAVLMPGAGPNDVAHLAQRLSSCLETVRYRPPGALSDIPLSLSVGMAVFPQEASAPLAALHLADERLLRVKSGERGHGAQAQQLRSSLVTGVEGFSMLDSLVVAVDNKDRYTRCHSEDVLFYCLQIAEALALDPAISYPLQVAALLHDVGKIGIPDHILRKPGKLTEAEYVAMQQHPVMGAAIVAAVAGLEGTLGAVRHHHERWDGGGYPDGLVREDIPLEARIMAVADAYSAMTTDRPYRKGMAPEEARAVLEAGAGTQWDPCCVHAFLQEQRKLLCLKANIPLLLPHRA